MSETDAIYKLMGDALRLAGVGPLTVVAVVDACKENERLTVALAAAEAELAGVRKVESWRLDPWRQVCSDVLDGTWRAIQRTREPNASLGFVVRTQVVASAPTLSALGHALSQDHDTQEGG